MKRISVIIISIIIVVLIIVFIGLNAKNYMPKSPKSIENKDATMLGNMEKEYMEEYEIAGYIKIPNLNLNIPILKEATSKSLKLSAGIVYGKGLNEIGNTTITGLNFTGDSFENIHKLEVGDVIYVTNPKNQVIVYEIYDKKIVKDTDVDYITRNTNNKREITLYTGNYDDLIYNRLIILAREKA